MANSKTIYAGLVTLMLAVACHAATPNQAITINYSAQYAPPVQVYQANARTFDVTLRNGNAAVDLTGKTAFMWWGVTNTSASIVTASCAVVSATGGTFRAAFSPTDLNTNGVFVYGVGVESNGVTTAREGRFTIIADPYASGAGPVSFVSNVVYSLYNWIGFPWQSSDVTDSVARSDNVLTSNSIAPAVTAATGTVATALRDEITSATGGVVHAADATYTATVAKAASAVQVDTGATNATLDLNGTITTAGYDAVTRTLAISGTVSSAAITITNSFDTGGFNVLGSTDGEHWMWRYFVAGVDYQTPLVAGTDYFAVNALAGGMVKCDGNGSLQQATAGTDYQAPLTAGTDYFAVNALGAGMVKCNGAGSLEQAQPGTDYQAPLVAGTDYLAPNGDGSQLTGVQTPLVAGTDYLAPNGDGSQLTGVQMPLVAGTDYQTPLVAGTDYQTPLVAGTDYQTPLVAGTDYQTPLVAGTDYLPMQFDQWLCGIKWFGELAGPLFAASNTTLGVNLAEPSFGVTVYKIDEPNYSTGLRYDTLRITYSNLYEELRVGTNGFVRHDAYGTDHTIFDSGTIPQSAGVLMTDGFGNLSVQTVQQKWLVDSVSTNDLGEVQVVSNLYTVIDPIPAE